MEYPEFLDLVLSWDLPIEWAENCWLHHRETLEAASAANVEAAFRGAMLRLAAEQTSAN